MLKVKRNQLQEGCILAKDIYLEASQPLMKKNTVLFEEHLFVLSKFLVADAWVEKNLINGTTFIPSEIVEEETNERERFIDIFLRAVRKYKQQYQLWRTGQKINLNEVTAIIKPVIKRVMEYPKEIMMLHHLGTREDYLYHHAISVAVLSAFIGNKMKLSEKEWMELGLAGALIDCGMCKVPMKVTDKDGPLDEMEYELIRKHPVYGYRMLKELPYVKDTILLAVLQHHEREDGSGYPLGTSGNKIHLYGKIVAVADIYHAMTSERYYRTKQSPYRVLEAISKDHFGMLSHEVVQTLMNSLLTFTVGTRVRLTGGREAEIVFIDQKSPTRPMVKITNSEEIIDLSKRSDLHIDEVLL